MDSLTYYYLSNYQNEKVDGTGPQVREYYDPKGNFSENSFLTGNLPKYVPRLKLHGRAKITDFISVSMLRSNCGLVVSIKALKILVKNNSDLTHFRIEVVDKFEKVHQYFYVFSKRTDEYFDLKKCSFVDTNTLKFINRFKGIKNLEELNEIRKSVSRNLEINFASFKESIPSLIFCITP